jgi:hypothetical protein
MVKDSTGESPILNPVMQLEYRLAEANPAATATKRVSTIVSVRLIKNPETSLWSTDMASSYYKCFC